MELENGKSKSIRFGTCSWNYDSWVGLIYQAACYRSYEYLKHYSLKYKTAEIDSWFYKMPTKKEVLQYKESVPEDFTFTCKVPQEISLTHFRQKEKSSDLIANPNFLSPDYLNVFLENIELLIPRLDGIILEFEYLSKAKMPGVTAFLENLDTFIDKVPKGIAIALEPRNSNYMVKSYFEFIKRKNVIHVFSEKQFMPHVYDIYKQYKEFIGETVIIRLLGGNRAMIEEKTGGCWNTIVDSKEDIPLITSMIQEMNASKIIVNVNNHYEGCAPLTIEKMEKLIGRA